MTKRSVEVTAEVIQNGQIDPRICVWMYTSASDVRKPNMVILLAMSRYSSFRDL